jgi:DNA polymerase III subunit gamma/tau
VINGRRDLPWVPDPRLGFEMTLLRLLAFRPGEGAPKPVGATSVATPSGTRSIAAKAAPASVAAEAAPTGAVVPADLDWDQRLETLGLEGFATQLARHCEWRGREGDTVRLGLDASAKHLLKDDRRAAIEQALARQLGAAVKVMIEVVQAAGTTPARLDEQRDLERQRAAETSIETDPTVRALKEKFGATVRAGSVQPASPGSNGNGVTK